MKSSELLEVIGEAQDDYILDAKTAKKKHTPVWVKWAAMAACLCLIVAGAWRFGIAFLGSNVEDPFREGQLYEMSSLDDLPPTWPVGGYPDWYKAISGMKNLDLENATFELYYAEGGDPSNVEDWYRLLINTYEDPELMIVCVFNGRRSYEEQKVDMIFTKDATETIEINGTTVEIAPNPNSLKYDYWHYSIFEYSNVVFDVRCQSNDADMIYTVLNKILGSNNSSDPNGIVAPGNWPDNIDPETASIAVFPDTEELQNVKSATLTDIDEGTAYSFEKLGVYLPTHIKEGYHFAKASLYETVMKDGTKYYQLRVTFADGDITEADPTLDPETGEQSKDAPITTANTYMVFIMNYQPGEEYTIYSGNALTEYIRELPSNGVFHFSLDDLYVGFVTYDLTSEDVLAVVDSMK